MFDKLLLLSSGSVAYSGQINDVEPYFQELGYPVPMHINPAEYLLDLINTDFASASSTSHARLEHILSYRANFETKTIQGRSNEVSSSIGNSYQTDGTQTASTFRIPFTLAHRSCIKSYRDIIAYGIRVAM